VNELRALEQRAAGADDGAFLQDLYRATRQPELALTNWSDEQKDAFVAMQYEAQDHHYRAQYPDAAYDVVIVDGSPAGRISVDRGVDAIALLDICFMPPYRGQGLGTALLRRLQDEAAESGRSLRLHVELGNPAARLYERLGFVVTGEHGLYQEMEWHAVS